MNKSLYQNIFHPFYHNMIKRDRFYDILDLYNKTQFWSREQIAELQLERLNKLLVHAYENTGYYKKLFSQIGIKPVDIKSLNDLTKIPFLTKDIVNRNFKDVIVPNLISNRGVIHQTSGTTGEKFRFYNDKQAMLNSAVLGSIINNWIGIDIGDKVLAIWGSRSDVLEMNSLKNRIKSHVRSIKLLSGNNLNEENLFNYYNIIEKYNPKLISGYPSTLEVFSDFLMKHNFRLEPKSIRTEGELLIDFTRNKISKAFNTSVYNYYSSRDITSIAHECRIFKNLHILSPNVILEVVDENGEIVFDKDGDIVLTHLNNFVMPFIRYKIGDKGILTKKQCECGISWPLLTEVNGRRFEIIKFPNGNSVQGVFWPYLFKRQDGIKKFRVIKRDSKIDIYYIPEKGLKKEFLEKIEEAIKKIGGKDVEISFNEVNEIPTEENGKYKYIINMD